MPARPAGAVISLSLAQRDREKALRRVAKLRQRASAEIERLIAFLHASDPYAATELEEQIDDEPCDDNELDGPENGEDEESAPPEPSLGSVGEQHIVQTGWAGGTSRDLKMDDGIPASPIRTASMNRCRSAIGSI
jgi:hypothetical protein